MQGQLVRSSTVPTIYDPVNPVNSLKRTRTDTGIQPKQKGMSYKDRDRLISELENYINSKNISNEYNDREDFNTADNYTADEVITQDDEGREAKFFYFIGRLNPPHNGHIKALEALVQMANSEGSTPLILLGSGPRGERTMDNPITFETKEQFIRSILPGHYIISKMDNPAKNVSDYISEGLEKSGDQLGNIQDITITHIAGGKDEDATKLSFALKSAEKTARGLVPGASIKAGVEAIDAAPTDSGEAMSATKVRKDAYRTVLDGTNFEGWPQEYKDFYGVNAEQIYNEILFPLSQLDYMPEANRRKAINDYINVGKLPESESSQKPRKRKGGTKRNPRKNKKKTQKRKRRVSRRKY
jgi:hypothetical protein